MRLSLLLSPPKAQAAVVGVIVAMEVDAFLPLFIARVVSPVIVLLATFSLFFARQAPPPAPSPIVPVVVVTTVPRRATILALLSLAALTYLLDGLAFVVFAVLDHEWPRHTAIPINTVAGLAAFAGLAALGTWKDLHGVSVWGLKRLRLAIIVSLALDCSLAVLLGRALFQGPGIPEKTILTIRNLVHIVLPAFRVLILFPLIASLQFPRVSYNAVQVHDDLEEPAATDSSFLLPSHARSSTGLTEVTGFGDRRKYGTFNATSSTLHQSAASRPTTPTPGGAKSKVPQQSEISLEPSWSEIFHRIKRLSPYLWPKKSRKLQLLAFACILILLARSLVNFVVPLTIGKIVAILEGRASDPLWYFLLAYVGLRFLQGSGGLSALRDALWAPVMQYSDREMSQLSFDHILNLSFAWHTHRKTGEVLRVLDRGAAINRTFELIMFNILPTFIDVVVALGAFCYFFQWVLAVVIFFVMFAYVYASVYLTQRRTRLKRQMNERDIATRGIHTDCLLNYETVKYFCGEEHEGERYADAIREYQTLESKVILSLNLLNLTQNFILTLGLLVGSLIVVQDITSRAKPGASEFIIFITYLAQLYNPLNQLGAIYRSINTALVDTEKLLALLNEPTEVNDQPNAPDLIVTDGEIEFDNVNFSYDGRTTALHNISFKVAKGQSVALVGESGAGKSTILRLLYRFYDLKPGEGRILIDGQDIRDVTQKSLRRAIGVVPQDSVLFNASIAYNIGYGKFGANIDEIEDAARSAQIHDRIVSFPDGYGTKVGERGVRLSGGEKQRVSIARTLLKNPPILLLDEATSALDTSTEKDIQKALQNLVQGRSSLSIAHRLSTIASADIIIVFKEGQIVEQGSFRELIARDGAFASMWADQASSGDDPALSLNGLNPKKETVGYQASASASLHDEAPAHFERAESILGTSEPGSKDEEERDGESASHEKTSQVVPFPGAQDSDEADAKPLPTEVVPPRLEASLLTDEPEELEPQHKLLSPVVESPVTSTGGVQFPGPISFPASDDTESEHRPIEPVKPTSPGVTFVGSPPLRTDTPDPDAEPKRKRISSQNFQRLARRISLTTRRSGSSSSMIPIPGLKRSDSPRVSTDEGMRAEGSAIADSPSESLKAGEDKGKLKKKDKKDKGKKGTL